MNAGLPLIKPAFAAIALIFALAGGGAASPRLDALFAQLREASPETTPQLAEKIRQEMGKSGSAAMDLLRQRGEDALGGDSGEAIGHLTALIDHAPDFAPGYALRAEAYFAAELWGPAIADLERALALEPRHFDAMISLAFLLETLERPEAALAVWDRVEALMPAAPEINEARARLGTKQGLEI